MIHLYIAEISLGLLALALLSDVNGDLKLKTLFILSPRQIDQCQVKMHIPPPNSTTHPPVPV